ncbi:AMP-binding protein [Trueperella abortisuis]|uniref:O-succinylbenzoic acid--CoA ligase n=1 Tax=Trueperella abortisuis TaxID=445930 RepID=A0ABT9PK98_9ACTO|nr:AMP-binding protein [Trueperella abortisuis]MDP9833118.1 O-succinylbenzoic acid--CoA ligase [Trueperella abortisuis]
MKIIDGGRGRPALERVHDAVMAALRTWLAGGDPEPLFVVAPGTDRRAVADEIAGFQAEGFPVPAGTGLLMRTSGSTTGQGKIVALSWQSLTASAHATHAAFGGPGRWVCQLPLDHIAGFQTVARACLAELEALAAGATPQRAAALRPAYINLAEPAAIRGALRPAGSAPDGAEPVPTYLSVVPTQLRRILANPELTGALRGATVLVGGAAADTVVLDAARAAGLTVHTSYGMTETCGGCVYDGRPIGDTEILIDDGRIALRGTVVATCYLGTDEGFDPPARLRAPGSPATHLTRDAGRISGGALEVLGRIDDAITTGGLTVMPSLIEESLAKTGHRAVVVGVPHPEWGEAVVAVVDDAVNAAQSCDITVMRSWVKLELGEGWAPTYVVGVSDIGGLPMTDSGKVNRRALAETVEGYLGL